MSEVKMLTPEKIITTIKNKKTGKIYETEEALKAANIPEEDVQRSRSSSAFSLDVTSTGLGVNRSSPSTWESSAALLRWLQQQPRDSTGTDSVCCSVLRPASLMCC